MHDFCFKKDVYWWIELDDVVNKYIKYCRAIKMRPVDIKPCIYISFSEKF